ncbi:hypothetical protein AB4158_09585, partial [Vibrio splendidus]
EELKSRKAKAELGYPALLFYCLSNLLSSNSILLFLLFVSRISVTRICSSALLLFLIARYKKGRS